MGVAGPDASVAEAIFSLTTEAPPSEPPHWTGVAIVDRDRAATRSIKHVSLLSVASGMSATGALLPYRH